MKRFAAMIELIKLKRPFDESRISKIACKHIRKNDTRMTDALEKNI